MTPSKSAGRTSRAAWVVGHLTATERLLLFAAIFAAPFFFLTALFIFDQAREIRFLATEQDGVAALGEVWPGLLAEAGRADLPGQADRPLAAPGYDRRLGLDGLQPAVGPDAQLARLADIADVSDLTLDRKLDSYYLGHALSVSLPRLVAAAADARAASALPPDEPGRAGRLAVDQISARAAAGQIHNAMARAAASTARRADRRAVLAADQALQQAAGRAATPDAMVPAADQAWRAARRVLDLVLQARLQGATGSLALNLGIFVLLLTAAAYIAGVLHRDADARQKALLAVMARLVRGDAAVEVPCLGDRNETGRIAEALVAFKQALIERARLREESQAATRAKIAFLGNVSHEIRTPLNGIIGMASALARTRLGKAQREMTEVIFRSGHTVERLLTDILDLSRMESGGLQLEVRPFRLPDVIAEIVAAFRDQAELKGVTLGFECVGEVAGDFEGDDVRLAQVVANLVSNALKFTDRGAVIVRLALECPSPAASTCDLVIVVEDTGAGFDQAIAPYLFERFTQADSSIARRYGGAGLGLPISKAILDLMGGSIEAASTRGVGSRFKVRVPLRRLQDRAPATAPGGGAAAAAQQRPLRILVVEDHPVNRLVLQCMLEPLGASLTMAADGVEGVRRFFDERFDLVLMDVQMPAMDGLAATRAMRAIERERGGEPTPIAMITANVSAEHQIAAIAAGADAHLGKPVDQDLLWELVAAVASGAFPGRAAPASAD